MSECISTGLLVQQVILYLDIKLFAVYCCTVNTFAILQETSHLFTDAI